MMPRLRKAWAVTVDDYDDEPHIHFAPNAGKARMDAWRTLLDCGSSVRIIEIIARRAKAHDVLLPDRDPIADQLTAEQIHCLLHAFGGNDDPYKAGYRNHYYTNRDDPNLVALEKFGLMAVPTRYEQGDLFDKNRLVYFLVTDKGEQVALSLIREYK